MATKILTGDAIAKAKKVRLTLGGDPGEASTLRATIGRKYIDAQCDVESDEDTLASLLQDMETVWNNSTLGEFAEVTALYGTDAAGFPYVDFEADTPGQDFDVTFSGPYPTIDIDTVQEGADGINEVQSLYFAVVPTSGTWTISFDPGSGTETSISIPYNANAAVVKLAIVTGMASVADADLDVTGAGTVASPFLFAFKGAYANQNLNQITATTSSLSASSIKIETIQKVGDNMPEIQLLMVSNFNAAGKFQISADGGSSWATAPSTSTTVPTAGALQTQVNELFGAGVCTVTAITLPTNRSTESVHYAFQFTFAGGTAHQLLAFRSTGGANDSYPFDGAFKQVNAGGGNSNEKQLLFLSKDATYGYGHGVNNYKLTFGANTTADLDTTTAATIQTALTGLASIGAGNATVTGITAGLNFGTYLAALVVEFVSGKAAADEPAITVALGSSGTGDLPTLAVAQNGSAVLNEKQAIKIIATGGTFTVSDGTNTTSAIAYNASNSTVQTRLSTDIASLTGNVSVTGSGTFADPFVIEFINGLANTDVALLIVDGSSLTSTVTATIDTDTEGEAGIGQSWYVVIYDATGGTFTFSFEDQKTTGIAFGASATTVQSALEALTNVGTGNMTVSGAGTVVSPYVITCANALAGVIQPKIKADNTSLTNNTGTAAIIVTTEVLQASKGPMHWDDDFNWYNPADGTAGVPVTGDDVILNVANVNIRYGLDQSAVLLNSIHATSLFENSTLGNLQINPNGYWEYRDTHLKIGLQGDFDLTVGEGIGGGSSLLNFDFGTSKFIARVLATNGPENGEQSALNIRGTNANNTLELIDGFVGMCLHGGESATLVKLTQRDGDFRGGKGLTIGAGSGVVIDQTGGSLTLTDVTVNGETNLVA